MEVLDPFVHGMRQPELGKFWEIFQVHGLAQTFLTTCVLIRKAGYMSVWVATPENCRYGD
jgi:hypothetical protein